ncbi:MAG: dihydrofolate reductase family protein, partial [Bacteroidetes bacterium]|nr:dihydrofolate reductase family protein [Bacteroidota bacterium]
KYMLTGGIDLPSQLIQLGLVDEYLFLIYPTFGGKGKRLFEHADLTERLRLKLVGTKVFESGSVLLRYVKG